jgi:hypothetical protein
MRGKLREAATRELLDVLLRDLRGRAEIELYPEARPETQPETQPENRKTE